MLFRLQSKDVISDIQKFRFTVDNVRLLQTDRSICVHANKNHKKQDTECNS